MRLKPRTIPVIALSSLIIAAVLALTLSGFYAYLEWKEENMRKNYKLALYDLNGDLFGKYLIVNLQTKIDTEGVFKDRPIVEGTIKNTSNKKIYSLKLKIAFNTPAHQVIYVASLEPINFLRAEDSTPFKYQLKDCPSEVLDFLRSKLKFAKLGKHEQLELVYKIEGLDIR